MSYEKERHAGWLELFYDLVFAAAIAQLGQNLSHAVTIFGFLNYVTLFVIVVWAWTGATFYATRFDVDDLVHRILVLLQMGGAVALAVNIHDAMDETSIGFALSYITIRIFLIMDYLRTGFKIVETSSLTRKYVIGFSFTVILWLISLFVPSSFRYIVWISALIIDIVITVVITKKHFDLSPNKFHLSERFGLFVIIVLGETVFGLVTTLAIKDLSTIAVFGMGSGITIAFGLWWIYFDTVDGSAIRALKEQRRIGIYLSWLYLHFPLLIGIASLGDGISHLIKADQILPISYPERWLMCISVALCLLSIGFIHIIIFEANSLRIIGLKWFFYRFISALAVLTMAIVDIKITPITLLFAISLICIIQVAIDLRNHPHHRVFKL
ncbi:MAG: low temperature requirement protein A [Candidatus Nitrosocosmicus sp.]